MCSYNKSIIANKFSKTERDDEQPAKSHLISSTQHQQIGLNGIADKWRSFNRTPNKKHTKQNVVQIYKLLVYKQVLTKYNSIIHNSTYIRLEINKNHKEAISHNSKRNRKRYLSTNLFKLQVPIVAAFSKKISSNSLFYRCHRHSITIVSCLYVHDWMIHVTTTGTLALSISTLPSGREQKKMSKKVNDIECNSHISKCFNNIASVCSLPAVITKCSQKRFVVNAKLTLCFSSYLLVLIPCSVSFTASSECTDYRWIVRCYCRSLTTITVTHHQRLCNISLDLFTLLTDIDSLANTQVFKTVQFSSVISTILSTSSSQICHIMRKFFNFDHYCERRFLKKLWFVEGLICRFLLLLFLFNFYNYLDGG